MAKKKGDGCVHTVLESTESDHEYHTIKNQKVNPERLELKKYDPTLMRVVAYRESKSKSGGKSGKSKK
jgi:large subunit ribosomal protein L33